MTSFCCCLDLYSLSVVLHCECTVSLCWFPISGHEVKCVDDGKIGTIHRITAYGICIKIGHNDDKLSSYRWIDKEEYPMKLTLHFAAQRNVGSYEFAVKKGQKDLSKKISSKQKRQFSYIENFEIPCSALLKGVAGASFLGVYVQRRSDTQCIWGRLKVLKYPVDAKMTVSVQQRNRSIDDMMDILQKTGHEIMEKRRFLKHFGLDSGLSAPWASQIASHPLLFSICRYRRKLIIERLIVELHLFSTEWVQSILKRKNLSWLVENRRISRLHDHYRVYVSQFSITYCEHLYVCNVVLSRGAFDWLTLNKYCFITQCRWLKLKKNTTMRYCLCFLRIFDTNYQFH